MASRSAGEYNLMLLYKHDFLQYERVLVLITYEANY